MNNGIFTISLDLELHWGVSLVKTVDEYRSNLGNTRQAIDAMLQLFRAHEIHVTWATVGMLFCRDKKELLELCMRVDKPRYKESRYSNYLLAQEIGSSVNDDPYHYGGDILQRIAAIPHQEIATHTFSHFYCLEEGAELKHFASDLDAAMEVGRKNGHRIQSIVFPRNQYGLEHLAICKAAGIKTYRGTEKHWMYKPVSDRDETRPLQLLRLADAYFNLSGGHTYIPEPPRHQELFNIPSSRLFRYHQPKMGSLERLKMNRIKNEMTSAAKNNRLYHLWWHPHNFGFCTDKNIENLKEILVHYELLKKRYGFQSLNMIEVYESFSP